MHEMIEATERQIEAAARELARWDGYKEEFVAEKAWQYKGQAKAILKAALNERLGREEEAGSAR